MNKSIITTIVVAVIVGAASFFGGMKYQQSKDTAQAAAQRQQFSGQSRGGAGGRNGAGFTAGQIISNDGGRLTVKLRNGNTQIVILPSSASIGKVASGTPDDLVVGSNVIVTGQANSDGSITAQSVNISPTGMFIGGPRPSPSGQPGQ